MRTILIAAGVVLAVVALAFVKLYPYALTGSGAHLVLKLRPERSLARAEMLALVQHKADGLGWPTRAHVRMQGDLVVVDIERFSDMAFLKRYFGAAPSLAFRLVDGGSAADDERLRSVQFPTESTLEVHRRILFTARHLSGARLDFDQRSSEPIVALTFDAEGARALARLTRRYRGNRMAIVLDGTVITAPNIREPITGGGMIISGNFTTDEAQRLAASLDAAAGDWPFTLVEARQT